jgi:hypothetical protein
LIGKWDRFPVVGFRAWRPDEEVDEEPLLVHPVKMRPSDHLVYRPNGVIGWKTECGESTVKILGLNEYLLPDRRKDRYESVRSVTADYVDAYRQDKESEKTKRYFEKLNEIQQGYGEFTVYALMAIEDEVNEIQNAIEQLSGNDDAN